ncbi:MAG: cytochrome P450 [Alphaproteobacteria bacterium]|nr:cytochrome P450 [Alphaproteobacteria bacterium]
MTTTLPDAPGPRGDLLLGSVLDFKTNPLEFCRYMASAYGDVSRVRMGTVHWYLVTNPADIWDIMTTRAELFPKPAIAARLWKEFLGDGLLTSEGAEWRRQTTMMKPAMHRERLAVYGDVMAEYTDRMVDAWSPGEQRDVHADFTALTLRIVCKTLFDADVARDAPAVGEAMEVLQEVMVEHIHLPIPLPAWWPTQKNQRKVKALSTLKDIVGRLIRERRASGEDTGDLLSMLLASRDEAGSGMTDQEVFDQAMTLFFAGHETSANGLTWAWYLLARHPEVVARMRDELDTVVGDRAPSMADLRDLPYLDAVVHECLRVMSPVWLFMKEAAADTEIGGFRVPKGSPIAICPYITQRDARWWAEPEVFRPERFEKARRAEHVRGAWIPFSGGARVCFGKSFAMTELRLVLATMVQRLDPVIPEGHWPVKVSELSLHPRGGLPIEVRPRPDLRRPVRQAG